MYESKFRAVEKLLRPRDKFKHHEAVELLATVVKDADEEIQSLKEENDRVWVGVVLMGLFSFVCLLLGAFGVMA